LRLARGLSPNALPRPAPRGWRRAEILFAAAAALALGFTALALAVARVPGGGAFDRRVDLRIHGSSAGAALALLRSISFFGSAGFIAGGSVVVAAFLLRIRAPRRLRAFLLAVVGAVVWVQVLKLLFHRARPHLFDPVAAAVGYSFPSGHSALSAAFFGAVAGLAAASEKRRRHAVAWLAAGFAAVVLIGLSRVALGVHWPTDVLGGWTIGFAWLTLVFAYAENSARRVREK
jgi:undecaprenyl-diphosphatase